MQHVLSKLATEEILGKLACDEICGDEFCFLIAVRSHGKPMRFFPYGTELAPDGIQPCEENEESILEISIKKPKIEFAAVKPLSLIGTPPIPKSARCRCKHDGEWEDC